MDYLLNLHFARKGLLAKAVNLALGTQHAPSGRELRPATGNPQLTNRGPLP